MVEHSYWFSVILEQKLEPMNMNAYRFWRMRRLLNLQGWQSEEKVWRTGPLWASITVLPQPENMWGRYLFCTQLFSFIHFSLMFTLVLIKVTLLYSSAPDFWHYQYFSYLTCLPPHALSFMSLSKALTGGQSWEGIWGWDVPVLVSVRTHLSLVYHLVFMIWSLYMITQTWPYE